MLRDGVILLLYKYLILDIELVFVCVLGDLVYFLLFYFMKEFFGGGNIV